MPIDEGTRLGRYEIRSKIGAGGMGEVWARDKKLVRDVAIKVGTLLRESYASREVGEARVSPQAVILLLRFQNRNRQATYSVSLPVSDFFSSLETNLTVGPVTEWFVTRLAAPTESDTFFVERIFVSHSVEQFGGAPHKYKGHLALRGLKNQPFDSFGICHGFRLRLPNTYWQDKASLAS